MTRPTDEVVEQERKSFEMTLLFRSHMIPPPAEGSIVRGPDGCYARKDMEFAFTMWMAAKGHHPC